MITRFFLTGEDPFWTIVSDIRPHEAWRLQAAGNGWEVYRHIDLEPLPTAEDIAAAAVAYVEAFKEHPRVTSEWQSLRDLVGKYRGHQ